MLTVIGYEDGRVSDVAHQVVQASVVAEALVTTARSSRQAASQQSGTRANHGQHLARQLVPKATNLLLPGKCCPGKTQVCACAIQLCAYWLLAVKCPAVHLSPDGTGCYFQGCQALLTSHGPPQTVPRTLYPVPPSTRARPTTRSAHMLLLQGLSQLPHPWQGGPGTLLCSSPSTAWGWPHGCQTSRMGVVLTGHSCHPEVDKKARGST